LVIKLKIPRGKGIHAHLSHPVVKASVAGFIIVCTVLFGIFAYYYVKYQKIVDKRLSGPIFANSAKIYAAPETMKVGESAKISSIAAELRRAGYTEESDRNSARAFFVPQSRIRHHSRPPRQNRRYQRKFRRSPRRLRT